MNGHHHYHLPTNDKRYSQQKNVFCLTRPNVARAGLILTPTSTGLIVSVVVMVILIVTLVIVIAIGVCPRVIYFFVMRCG